MMKLSKAVTMITMMTKTLPSMPCVLKSVITKREFQVDVKRYHLIRSDIILKRKGTDKKRLTEIMKPCSLCQHAIAGYDIIVSSRLGTPYQQEFILNS